MLETEALWYDAHPRGSSGTPDGVRCANTLAQSPGALINETRDKRRGLLSRVFLFGFVGLWGEGLLWALLSCC